MKIARVDLTWFDKIEAVLFMFSSICASSICIHKFGLVLCLVPFDSIVIRLHFARYSLIHSEFRVAQTIFIRDIHRSRMDSDIAGSNCSMPSIKVTGSDPRKMLRIDNITKSQQDNRDYRGLQLANGMKVLLVSDPSTDKSAAAMTVDVGHMSDPENVPGLAHFCEHMLFLGTKKYPNENAYSTYLTENGGLSNASTYADNTKYYFDVAHDKLDGALDRFAQFFVAPLFTEGATDREINAVNSEHEKNLAIDVWRIRQVNKALADQTHAFSKFGKFVVSFSWCIVKASYIISKMM